MVKQNSSSILVSAVLLTGIVCGAAGAANFYCRYCGIRRSSVQSLTAGTCPRHPAGPGKGRHALYQGQEKAQYTCVFCGVKRSDIASLTAGSCSRRPAGPYKGRHEPAL